MCESFDKADSKDSYKQHEATIEQSLIEVLAGSNENSISKDS